MSSASRKRADAWRCRTISVSRSPTLRLMWATRHFHPSTRPSRICTRSPQRSSVMRCIPTRWEQTRPAIDFVGAGLARDRTCGSEPCSRLLLNKSIAGRPAPTEIAESVQDMDKQAALELRFKPCGFRRHNLAHIGNRHQTLDGCWIESERRLPFAGIHALLQRLQTTNTADEIDALVTTRIF